MNAELQRYEEMDQKWCRERDKKIAAMLAAYHITEYEFLAWVKEKLQLAPFCWRR